MDDQIGLFSDTKAQDRKHDNTPDKYSPLAFRARPKSLDEFFGQEETFSRFPFLKSKQFPAVVIWGPPGTGKTTLAHILAAQSNKDFYKFNAVLGGVNDLKKLIKSAIEVDQQTNKKSIIFIDEIHRFNKSQQDALLPYVEAGDFTLVGATTENPRSGLNRALLSRVQIIELKKLSEKNLFLILQNSASKFKIPISREGLELIADYSNGDARNALNTLELIEIASRKNPEIDFSEKEIKPILLENARDYDRNKNRHYDVISAFIKSMRGSDPDSALLWLAIMLDGGEDPVFIARRLVIFASEDIGNADPQALTLATSAFTAVSAIGMPEARINLAQIVTYLASTVKSNACYQAINKALEFVKNTQTIEVPSHLKNFPPKNGHETYLYPHSYDQHFIKQNYSSNTLPKFYNPSDQGTEKKISARLNDLWGNE